MLEGEEVLESAQETGYRLCVSKGAGEDGPADDFSKVFSCTWDPNNRDRLYVCSQKGTLRVYNLRDGNNRDFCVLFRRFTDTETKQEGRHVPYHWDKMIPIPDRPDEFIFCLGVTRSLMYSALPGTEPYPQEPFISKSTRGDFSGYIYGTPVMELWVHPARVTSVAVAQSGQVLASGDEQGNLKLLMLRLLDNIIPTASNAKKAAAKAHDSSGKQVPSFSPFLPEYKCTLAAHEGGPIFSLAWLPMPSITAPDSVDEDEDEDGGYVKNKSRYYALATGSADRCVKIWGISCSISRGLVAKPIMTLDTLSTHVLSMHAFLKSEPPSRADKAMNKTGSLKFRTGSGSSVYLAAGTNVGAIYVWNLSTAEVFGAAHGSEPTKLIDDGSKLHSLLQTSDRPIINIAVSAALDPNARTDETTAGYKPSVVLVASDTKGIVRTHRQAEDLPKGVYANGGSPHGSRNPITLCGEASYGPAMVVASAFQEHPKNLVNSAKGETWTGQECRNDLNIGDKAHRWKGSRMLITTSHGAVQIVQTDEAMYPTSSETAVHLLDEDPAAHDHDFTADDELSWDEDEESISSSVDEIHEPTQETPEGAAARAAVSAKRRGKKVKNTKSSTIKNVISAATIGSGNIGGTAPGQHAPGKRVLHVDTSFEEIPRGGSPYEDDAAPAMKSASSGGNTTKSDTTNVTFSSSVPLSLTVPVSDNGEVTESDDDSDSAPRAPLAKSQTTASPYFTEDAGRTPRAPTGTFETMHAGRTPKGGEATTFNTLDAGKTPRAPASNSNQVDEPFSAWEAGTTPEVKAPPQIVKDHVSTAVRFQEDAMGPTQASTPKVPSKPAAHPGRKPTRPLPPTPAMRPTAASRARSPSTSITSRTTDSAGSDDENPAAAPPKEEVRSELTAAEINSSRLLKEQMLALKERIDNDDVSVATLETTDSDRFAAMRQVLNIPMHAPRYNHERLTQILDSRDPNIFYVGGTKPAVIRKSTDPAWLHRKKTMGPTPEDLHPLYAPDPVVSIQLETNAQSSGDRQRVCVGGTNDLHHDHDPESFYPQYKNSLQATQIFGTVYSRSNLEQDQRFFEECYEQDIIGA